MTNFPSIYEIWVENNNEQKDRLPLAYFPPSQFCKKRLLKNENFFFKKTFLHLFFLIFPTLTVLLLLPKSLTIKVEKTFLRNNTI